jgi:hypothetical protein
MVEGGVKKRDSCRAVRNPKPILIEPSSNANEAGVKFGA